MPARRQLDAWGPGARPGRRVPVMFGFGKTTRDPLVDAKSAERWFAAQPAGDPLAIHAELMSSLGAIAERGRARSPAMAHPMTSSRFGASWSSTSWARST